MLRYVFLIFLCFFYFTYSWSQQTVGLFLNHPQSFNGYTLFSNNKTTYLINNCGKQINQWQSDYDPGLSMYLLPGGKLLRTARIDGSFQAGGLGGRVELYNWEGDLDWSANFATAHFHAHHDIEPLPNGHFLLLSWEKIPEAEAKMAGRQYSGELWSEKIEEIEMIGNDEWNVIWEWRLWDHLIQYHDPDKPNFGDPAEHPERVDVNYIGEGQSTEGDWIHANSISYHASLDQIMISSRYFSEIWIIDHSTSSLQAATSSGGRSGKGGDLLYRYGNPQTYQRGDAQDQLFFGQHDARWIPDAFVEGGKLMVLNNNSSTTNSAVEIWSSPLDSNGSYFISDSSAYGPPDIERQIRMQGFHSFIMSGAQMQPNGNILICESDEGHFFELNEQEELVWEYINPTNRNGGPVSQGGIARFNEVFRAERYAPDDPAFVGRELVPGPVVEINPWPSDCMIYDQVLNIGKRPIFQELKILSNPVSSILNIELKGHRTDLFMEMVDLRGIIILGSQLSPGLNSLDLSSLLNGIYFLRFQDDQMHSEVRKILKQ